MTQAQSQNKPKPAPIQTRSQRDLCFALERVQQVARENAEVKKIYGGLCHQFPVMVRTVGLAQTLAFHASKAGDGAAKASRKPREKAHFLLLAHVGELLGATGANPVESIRTLDTWAYLHSTRRILSAWIYFKRFAVSVLKVETGQAAQDDQLNGGNT